MQAKLNSLMKREVFGPRVKNSKGVNPIGQMEIFTKA